MKSITILLLLTIVSLVSVQAQTVVRFTPSSNTTTVYSNLDTAYEKAQDDDILYLSGHTFSFSNNFITKRLQWVGAGVHADSTNVTGATQLLINSLNISFVIRPTAGGSSFTGINFGNFRLNDCDVAGSISLVSFIRCKFSSDWISLSYTTNFAGSTLNYRFQECIFNTFVGGNGFSTSLSNIVFDNCLFGRGLFRLRTGTYAFNNCVFWASAAYDGIQQNYGCKFKNCIFWDAAEPNFIGGYMEQGNEFSNCVFSHATIPVGSGGTFPTVISNCKAGVSSLFVNTNGNFTYEDADDYHLLNGSAALTAGSNGGQCGIYGGTQPAKNSYVPYNPHISAATIAPATVNGQLNINITATAQNR